MPPLKSLSAVFNDMVSKPLDEAAFRAEAQKEGFVSRVIKPGDRVTKDFRTNRVNARVDASKNVERIYLG